MDAVRQLMPTVAAAIQTTLLDEANMLHPNHVSAFWSKMAPISRTLHGCTLKLG
jgi:hypothetical protein